MNQMYQSDRKARHGIQPDPPEPVRCFVKPECAGCPLPGHGFICWSEDGSCLLDRYRKKPEPPDDVSEQNSEVVCQV